MKKECYKAVAAIVVIGAIGSMIGWYWDGFIDCLGMDIHHVHFGPALVLDHPGTFRVQAHQPLDLQGLSRSSK